MERGIENAAEGVAEEMMEGVVDQNEENRPRRRGRPRGISSRRLAALAEASVGTERGQQGSRRPRGRPRGSRGISRRFEERDGRGPGRPRGSRGSSRGPGRRPGRPRGSRGGRGRGGNNSVSFQENFDEQGQDNMARAPRVIEMDIEEEFNPPIEVPGAPATERNVRRARRSQHVIIDCNNYRDSNVETFSVGEMTKECPICRALHFVGEENSTNTYNSCCHKGRVQPISFEGYPGFLWDLISNPQNPKHRNFKNNILNYNAALSFASIGMKLDRSLGNAGPPIIRCHGLTYHNTSHLHPENTQDRRYASMYIYDASVATERRMNIPANDRLDNELLTILHDYILANNPYARLFRTLHQMTAEQEADNITDVSLIFKKDPRRGYNEPTAPTEIGIIFRAGDDGMPVGDPDFVVYPRRDDNLIMLNPLSGHLQPMCYSLLFPNGEPGWSANLTIDNIAQENEHFKRTRLTQLQFYSSFFFERSGLVNPILKTGKLLHTFALDAYLMVLRNRLNWIKTHQRELRVERYQGLVDSLMNEAEVTGAQLGRIIVLPSTFEGSARNYNELYHDAMALVGHYGNPDLFITMTMNPSCDEITTMLAGQQPWERPDLITRVFKLKLEKFMRTMTEGKIFGPVAAWVYTIEFQKRGLPHVHTVFWLKDGFKLDTPEKIDQFISAEIPDVSNPIIRQKVLKNMIHHHQVGRCLGDNNQCSKHFPKELRQQTVIINGKILYRRRAMERDVILHNGRQVNNTLVVPYNPVLLKMFDCHINVEAIDPKKASHPVAYLFKYIHKGLDRAKVAVSENAAVEHDEIQIYIDGRYTSACEAFWRLFEYPMHAKSIAVYRLAIHKPLDQAVVFPADALAEEILLIAQRKKTTLTEFFELNKIDPMARNYLYTELADHYVWDNQAKKWNARRRGITLSRMYFVSPSDPERYFLRLLLQNVRGPQSFDDLKTVDGVLCETFREAAIQLGLVEDDNEWRRCLEEASTFQLPAQLRQTYALICIFNVPSDPRALFDEFKLFMIGDFLRKNPELSIEEAILEAVRDIRSIFTYNNFACDFLPEVPLLPIIDRFNAEEELAIAQELIGMLNPQQRQIYYELAAHLANPRALNPNGRVYFLDGPGGSGKTFLYTTLIAYCRGMGLNVCPYATTGIAADMLKGGTTAHSGFKLPIFQDIESKSNMSLNSFQARQILRPADLIIIDEVSMMSVYSFNIIDELLRKITDIDIPFGNKLIIFGGDFRQIPPIPPPNSDVSSSALCIKRSSLWAKVQQRSLITNMRSIDPEFNEWLLQLGEGRLPNQLANGLIDPELIEVTNQWQNIVPDKNALITAIYGEVVETQYEDNLAEVTQKVILTLTNNEAEALNNQIISLIVGETYSLKSADSVEQQDPKDRFGVPPEIMNALRPSGWPPHELKLKIGAFIMLIRNIAPRKGLLNGTRLVVTEIQRNIIRAKILCGSHQGVEALIPRIDFRNEVNEATFPFIMRRRQFPVIPAFALTINKSQGQSFLHVGIYLPTCVFQHGQLYVAMSRSRNPNNLRVCIEETPQQGKLIENSEEVFTKNIVDKNILN